MQITFYNFGKKTNSTKLVNVQGDTFNHCELKGGTNMVSPILVIKEIPTAWNPIWNYCRIPAFSRYYFISDWRWVNGVWECACACDVLATYKTQIGETSQYILRSSFTYDGNIIDTAYITKTSVQTNIVNIPTFFEKNLDDGFYVVGIIGSYVTATQGAITYYQMTASELGQLRNYLMSNNFLQNEGLANLTDFVPADAVKVIYNPFQYIASCQWFPFPESAIPAAQKIQTSTINFGWWTINLSAYALGANLTSYVRTGSHRFVAHPQSATRGDYLNKNPYTSCILRYPPFSEVEIPVQYIRPNSDDEIQIEISVDFITGLAYMNLYSLNVTESPAVRTMHLARLSTKLSVDIQLAQVGADYLAQHTQQIVNKANWEISNVRTAMSGISIWDPIGSLVNMGVNSIELNEMQKSYRASDFDSYIRNGAPQLLTGGSNGSLAAFKQNPVFCYTYYILVDENKDNIGRPLCSINQISDIPGYIMVQNPIITIPCLIQERMMIIQYMANGFYYE